MSVSQLPEFPATIENLPDKPNLSAQNMKAAFDQDLRLLYQKVVEIIDAVNGKADTPVSVSDGGTGGTTPQSAREGIGVYIGNTPPADMASTLNTGDAYIYVPDL